MLTKIGKILSTLYLVAVPAVGIAGDCTMQWDFTPDGIATAFELQRGSAAVGVIMFSVYQSATSLTVSA